MRGIDERKADEDDAGSSPHVCCKFRNRYSLGVLERSSRGQVVGKRARGPQARFPFLPSSPTIVVVVLLLLLLLLLLFFFSSSSSHIIMHHHMY